MKPLCYIWLVITGLVLAGSCAGIHLLAEHYGRYLHDAAEIIEHIF